MKKQFSSSLSDYKIQEVFSVKDEKNGYGNIYASKDEAKLENPDAEIISGYCVVSKESGRIPEGCNDWNDTYLDAIADYFENLITVSEKNAEFRLTALEQDDNGMPTTSTAFIVKSGWLQNFYGVNSKTKLDAMYLANKGTDDVAVLHAAQKDPIASGLQILDVVTYDTELEEKPEVGVRMGESAFLSWDEIDDVLEQWGTEYFGEHALVRSARDDTDFIIFISGMNQEDYDKFLLLYQTYDSYHDYEPEDVCEFENDIHGFELPAAISRKLLYDVIHEQDMLSYGTAVATHDGVFMMEYRFDKELSQEKNTPRKESLESKISGASLRAESEVTASFPQKETDLLI